MFDAHMPAGVVNDVSTSRTMNPHMGNVELAYLRENSDAAV